MLLTRLWRTATDARPQATPLGTMIGCLFTGSYLYETITCLDESHAVAQYQVFVPCYFFPFSDKFPELFLLCLSRTLSFFADTDF